MKIIKLSLFALGLFGVSLHASESNPETSYRRINTENNAYTNAQVKEKYPELDDATITKARMQARARNRLLRDFSAQQIRFLADEYDQAFKGKKMPIPVKHPKSTVEILAEQAGKHPEDIIGVLSEQSGATQKRGAELLTELGEGKPEVIFPNLTQEEMQQARESARQNYKKLKRRKIQQ